MTSPLCRAKLSLTSKARLTSPIITSPIITSLVVCVTSITSLMCVLMCVACDSDPALSVATDGFFIADPDQGLTDMNTLTPDLAPPQDMSPLDASPPPQDMAPLDMMMGGAEPPLGGVPDGPDCDPRLRAQSCEEGFSCWQRPGAYAHQGSCVEGDRCDPLTHEGCPPESPLCHLDGRATRCVSPSMSPRLEGAPCLTEDNRALPCDEGLVCNLSVCVRPCDPTLPADAPEESEGLCEAGRGCVDISERVGVNAGYCGFLGSCDPFFGTGCEPAQSCRWAVRPDDLKVVTFCSDAGTAQAGEPCLEGASGEQGCATGFSCIGPPNGGTCRQLCDTGAYRAPCPSNQACQEVLSLGPNTPVRGLGICITNQ